MTKMDVFYALVIVIIQVMASEAMVTQTKDADHSRWNISATVEDGSISVMAQYKTNLTDERKRLVLQLTCLSGVASMRTSFSHGVGVFMHGVCYKIRARSNATFTVDLIGQGKIIESVNRTVYVHNGLPWPPIEMFQHPASVNTSVVLVWKSASKASVDAFLLKYWCSSNSAENHTLRVHAHQLTLELLDGCVAYVVRLCAVNEHGQSTPLYFYFCANETNTSESVTMLNVWMIGGLTLAGCILAFLVSATCSFAYRHCRGRRSKEPKSPKDFGTVTVPDDVGTGEMELIYENNSKFYENVDYSQSLPVGPTVGQENTRMTDAMLSMTGHELAAQGGKAREESDEYEYINVPNKHSSCKSETFEDDNVDMYENVGTIRKLATSNLSENQSGDMYLSMDKCTPASPTRERRSRKNVKHWPRNSTTSAEATTPKVADVEYINPLLSRGGHSCRKNRSYGMKDRKYRSDLYDTAS